ncbi:MAG: hypothetical protein AAGH83_01665 [Pseudomonadota bacterium]
MRGVVLAFVSMMAAGQAGAQYVLTIEGTGLREYYCQIVVSLENQSDEPLTEISGFFYNYVGEDLVGRSKGTWFMGVEPGARAEATFETPNAPCDDVDRYEFILGACRIGAEFEDKNFCAGLISGDGPITVGNPAGS